MTNVSPVAVARATCPFCLFWCDLGIVSQFGQVTGVEYIAESPVNHGRLCARGNGAAAVINHPRRLTEPRSEGKRIDWERAWTELVDCFKNGNTGEIAFTLDRNLTNEEVGTILGFARALRVKTVGCSYLEPEGYFQYRIEGAEPAQLADIEAADLFIFVGDVFSQMPVIAKPVLDGRYRDRQHRFVTVDCIRTRTGFFADQAIITWP